MKPHGFKLIDCLGASYTRYFNTDGKFQSKDGISTELLELGNRLDKMKLSKAIDTAKNLCSKSGVTMIVYNENEFTE